MKKAFTLIAVVIMAFQAVFAQTDATGSNTTTQQVVVNSQAKNQQSVQNTSGIGIYNGLTGTYITARGFAPYKKIPSADGINEVNWPRFGIQIGAGQAYSFFTYEGVLEYMQTTYLDPTGNFIGNVNSLQGSARVGGMLPIQLANNFLLIPNVKGQLGGSFSFYSNVTTRFTAGVMGGIDFGFKLGGNRVITLGFVYEHRWYVYSMSSVNIGFLGGQLGIII